jgi:type IV pilus biogenesis protein CpaD/CtpE
MGVAPLLEVKMRRRSWRRQRSRFQEEKEHYADGLDGTKKTMTMEKEEEEIDADVYSGGRYGTASRRATRTLPPRSAGSGLAGALQIHAPSCFPRDGTAEAREMGEQIVHCARM